MSWKIKGAFLLFISNTLLGTDAGCYSSFTKKKNGVTFFDGENEIKDLSTKAEPGTTLTVKCANNFETFTNEVKLIPGVGAFSIYSTGGFPVRCTSNNQWSPRIDKVHLTDGTLTSETISYMCAVGCPAIQTGTHLVSYEGGMLTSEKYSPPVLPSRAGSPLNATVDCRPGYTRSVGDTGGTVASCSAISQWSSTAFVNCVKGCSDITKSVRWGETTAIPAATTGEPPFGPGDQVQFHCSSGFVLVGNETLVCKGDNTWNSDLPTCVYNENSRQKRDLSSGVERVVSNSNFNGAIGVISRTDLMFLMIAFNVIKFVGDHQNEI